MISLIVYARDREVDVLDTHSAILKACKMNNLEDYEIILVDDFSTDSTLRRMKDLSSINNRTSFYQTEESSGINAAILTGFKYSKGKIVFPIPGHNMFNAEAIATILRFSQEGKIILGYRDNLFKSRPFIKYVSSLLLLNFYCFVVNRGVRDIHGLNSYPRNLIEEAKSYRLGHGFHMIPITLGISLGYEIRQIPIAVNPNHKNRSSKKLKDNWPSLKSVFGVLQQLLTSLNIKKNSISK